MFAAALECEPAERAAFLEFAAESERDSAETPQVTSAVKKETSGSRCHRTLAGPGRWRPTRRHSS